MAAPPQVEIDWHTGTNPDVLLEAARPLVRLTTKFDPARHRRAVVYERRCRLFGCACARMVWDVLPTDARSAVMISERVAYGRATRANEIAAAIRVPRAAFTSQQHALLAAGSATTALVTRFDHDGQIPFSPTDAARSAAKSLATRAAGPAPPGGNPVAKEWQTAWNRAFAEARAHQAEIVRDIFPPLDDVVRAIRFKRDWLTSTVLALARQANESGEYSALPILADALQDAGCDNEVMLDRCRAPSGIHCRGNWVVDLVLGRE